MKGTDPPVAWNRYDNIGDATSVRQLSTRLTSISLSDGVDDAEHDLFLATTTLARRRPGPIPDGHQTLTTYDADRDVKTMLDPNGSRTNSTYGHLNWLTRTN